MIAIGLGLVLLIAAGLKVSGRDVSAVPQVGWFSHPMVQAGAAAWEAVLGLWLLCGMFRVWAWYAAIGTFLAFAGVSGYLGWLGQASCGCFGSIKASPWVAFGVDLIALALLAVGRPKPGLTRAGSSLPAGFAKVTLGSGVILASLTLYSTWMHGSPAAALAKLGGRGVYTPSYLGFGVGRPDEVLERELPVTNLSSAPLRLIGGTADCSCITSIGLPLTIAPGETAPVPVRLHVPESATGAFTRQALLWTDGPQRMVKIVIGCRVE